MKKSMKKILTLLLTLVLTLSMSGAAFADDEGTQSGKTYSITCNVTNSEGQPAGMYGVDSAIITEQADGTYLAKLIMTNDNRNLIALGDKKASTIHAIDWYQGQSVSGHKNFVIPVKALDQEMIVSFSDTERVESGKDFSNNQIMRFDSSTKQEIDSDPVVLDENSVLPAIGEDYTFTNNTNMFKLVKAQIVNYRDKEYAVIALSGTGYHNLFKGTYKQAVDNDEARENWIEGYTNTDGKVEFVVPTGNEPYIPLVAISDSYLAKYEQGQNPLARAFYPRQIQIDKDAKSMVSGDYENTKDLTIDNQVSMFKPGDKTELTVVGGPNSNNHKYTITLEMESDSYSTVRYTDYSFDGGNLDIKEKQEIALGEGNVFLDIKVLPDRENVLEFKSKKNGNWYTRLLTISEQESKATFYVTDLSKAKDEAEQKAAAAEQAKAEAEQKAAEAEQAKTAAEKKAADAEKAKNEAEKKAADAEKAKADAEKKAEAAAKASTLKAPAKASLKKVKKGKKRITVTWKKVPENVTGYEIQVTDKKGMSKTVIAKSNATKKVIKKLAKGKYKVKVRAVNTANGMTAYGKWSKTKTVKVS